MVVVVVVVVVVVAAAVVVVVAAFVRLRGVERTIPPFIARPRFLIVLTGDQLAHTSSKHQLTN